MIVNMCIRCFCKNIVALREKHRLTHTEMAKILHISEESVISLEKGEAPREVTADTVIYAASYFNLSANELFDM